MFLRDPKYAKYQSLAGKLFILCIIFFLAGCNLTGKPADNAAPNVSQGKQDETKQQQPADLSLPVYYVKFTESDAYLVREIHTVPYTVQVADAALQELIKDPKSILPPGTKVLGITIEKGLATVNFSEEVLNNHNVGSDGEILGIQSIVNTLTEFPNIEKVAFQVKGKTDERAKDWWGHVGLYDQPFTKDLSRVYEPSIWVTHPSPHQVASVPLLIKGSARVFEGAVSARLLDSTGKVLAESHALASEGAPGRGDFEMSMKYDPPDNGEGTLEVYWASPKDGSVQDKVTVPVQWP